MRNGPMIVFYYYGKFLEIHVSNKIYIRFFDGEPWGAPVVCSLKAVVWEWGGGDPVWDPTLV